MRSDLAEPGHIQSSGGLPGAWALVAILVLGAAVAGIDPAAAQYFGRNKVNYEQFDFHILHTPHFEIHYYPQSNEAAQDAGRMAERWYYRLNSVFDQEFEKKKPIILYSDHADFQQTNIVEDVLSEGTGGLTEPLKNRVVMPLTGDYAGTDHVLGHEIVHVFQFDIAFATDDTIPFRLNLLPSWLVEGMAEYLSVGREDPHTAMWMRDACLKEKFPTIEQLSTDPRFFPYRYGQALWAYIGGKWGDDKVGDIYRASGRRGMEFALSKELGVTPDSLSRMWARDLRAFYLPAMEGRARPGKTGKKLLAPDLGAGEINLAPVLSHDGKRVAFLSEKDLFSIDIFVADAATGKIQRKLLSSATNGHFDALRFIDSAGSWSPDGKHLAVVVFAKGNNELLVVDTDSGEIEEHFRPKGVGAISNPAWSPDGKTIAISGSAQGRSDLYLVDVASGRVDPITDDRYANLQPAWSPDGKYLAYVTDQGPGTDFATLEYEPMRIAVMELASRDVRILAPFPGTKHINPQFSPDGGSLYFISDREGFSDVYRVELATNRAYQVTRMATGVSGITALSPALTVSAGTGRVLFSAFEDGKYIVYGLDGAEALGGALGTPVASGTATVDAPDSLVAIGDSLEVASLPQSARWAGLLPPSHEHGKLLVSDYLADAEGGLPEETTFPVGRYKPKLQLDYIGAFAGGGVAVDRFGAAVGGGATAYFSDMLSDHQVGVALQANGTLKDIGAQTFYLNKTHRWNWGGVVGHIPFLNLYSRIYTSGDTLIVEELRERVFVDRASLFAAYPFSTTRRVEFSSGFTRYTFDNEIEQQRLLPNGQWTDPNTFDVNSDQALNLVQSAVALVGDNSFFGFTSPVQGYRYRAEIEPTFGSLAFNTLLLDYRRYLRFNPVTFAARGMHLGRYGADAENDRLTDLFIGYATLVRGYTSGSFDPEFECPPGDNDCPAFDRLVGSRIGVANLELRLPLLGTSQYGLLNFPYLPTELSWFFDGGMAWRSGDHLKVRFETDPGRLNTPQRYPVFSTGGSLRFNLLNALVLEAYLAFPFQRPEKDSVFGIQIAPGW